MNKKPIIKTISTKVNTKLTALIELRNKKRNEIRKKQLELHQKMVATKQNRTTPKPISTQPKPQPKQIQKQIKPTPRVGVVAKKGTESTNYLHKVINNNQITLSNDIGIGIIKTPNTPKLLESLKNLNKKTTVFLANTPEQINGIITINTGPNETEQINALLKCLKRFKIKIILNGETIIKPGLENLITEPIQIFGFLCGQGTTNDKIEILNGHKIRIMQNPTNQVIILNEQKFKQVGYLNPNSDNPYTEWINKCANGKNYKLETLDAVLTYKHNSINNMVVEQNAIYPIIDVPSVTYIIPFQTSAQNRSDAIKAVVQNIKAQKYPNIQIILAEQDISKRITFDTTVEHILAPASNQPFIKSLAFNVGYTIAKHNKLVLHDADMIVQDNYTTYIVNQLNTYESVHAGKSVSYLDETSTKTLISSGEMTTRLNAERLVNYYEGGSLACLKTTYAKLGGFCEDFIGYGNEDCEFFYRLINGSNLDNNRTIDLVHLYHGRSNNWSNYHNKNKEIEKKHRSTPFERRIKEQSDWFQAKYCQE